MLATSYVHATSWQEWVITIAMYLVALGLAVAVIWRMIQHRTHKHEAAPGIPDYEVMEVELVCVECNERVRVPVWRERGGTRYDLPEGWRWARRKVKPTQK